MFYLRPFLKSNVVFWKTKPDSECMSYIDHVICSECGVYDGCSGCYFYLIGIIVGMCLISMTTMIATISPLLYLLSVENKPAKTFIITYICNHKPLLLQHLHAFTSITKINSFTFFFDICLCTLYYNRIMCLFGASKLNCVSSL